MTIALAIIGSIVVLLTAAAGVPAAVAAFLRALIPLIDAFHELIDAFHELIDAIRRRHRSGRDQTEP